MISIHSHDYFWKSPKEHFHLMEKKIMFVSAFKDIGRASWSNSNRSVDHYLSWFSNLATRITYPLAVFVEEPIKKRLQQMNLSSSVTIHPYEDVKTFLDHYVDREREIMNSPSFQRLIHPGRKGYPETVHPEYTLINHSKINFVSHAKILHPDYDFYSWVDFGMFRDYQHIPRGLNLSEYPNKFLFHTLSYPGPRRSEEDMLQTNEVWITGSTFVIPGDQVEFYEKLYENKIQAWQKRGLADDDQSLILQLYYDHRDRFALQESPEWFSLFKILPHMNKEKRVHIYGDSHAHYSFKDLSLPYVDYHKESVTMFRIGRDRTLLNYHKYDINPQDTIVVSYGEIDCRCHIQRQIKKGRQEDDVIHELVHSYVDALKHNLGDHKKVVLVAVIPTTRQQDYERVYGPTKTKEMFEGVDADRSRYTKKVNVWLERLAQASGYVFFNGYDYCTRPDGTLNHEMSDTSIHLNENIPFLEQFVKLYEKMGW